MRDAAASRTDIRHGRNRSERIVRWREAQAQHANSRARRRIELDRAALIRRHRISLRGIGKHKRSLIVPAHQNICTRSSNHGARIVANHDRNIYVLRREVRQRHAQYRPSSIVKRQ